MIFSGTANRSGNEILNTLSSMGAKYEGDTQREQTHHLFKFMKGDLGKVVEVLGDVLQGSVDTQAFEATREQVRQIHDNSYREYERTTVEQSHYNSFRDHMLGQPTRGDADNLNNLTAQDIENFQNTNYTGQNIVLVGTGDVSHEELVDLAEQHFGSIPQVGTSEPANTDRAVYTPALLFARDDEMVNSNIGVFYDAPGLAHDDYWSFQLLKRIFGSYNIQENAEHLNDVLKQYNALHAMLGDLPDVTKANSHHFAYSDSGIFGNYFFGNEVFTRQMTYCGMALPTIYSNYMNDVEVYRARNRFYNELMNETGVFDQLRSIGPQVLHQGRRIPRSEIAKRLAHIDAYHMKHLCYEWFYDAEPSITAWGPIEGVSATGSYKFYKNHTMATVTNAHHGLYW